MVTVRALVDDDRPIAGNDMALIPGIFQDMVVEGIEPMRIVEHFTVGDEKNVRIRQVDDTANSRATMIVASWGLC